MTFWSLMVQIKAEPDDLEVKPSIYQLLSSDPSKCAPCSPDLWHLSRNKVLRPKALLSLSPGKTAAFSESAATDLFSLTKHFCSPVTSFPGYFTWDSNRAFYRWFIRKKTLHIYSASSWLEGRGFRQAGNFVWKSILCGSQYITNVRATKIPERNYLPEHAKYLEVCTASQ